MKIGHASYGYYDTTITFLVVNKNIIITDDYIGLLGYATTKEDVIDLVVETYDCNKEDVVEVLDMAFKNCQDVAPYKKGENND